MLSKISKIIFVLLFLPCISFAADIDIETKTTDEILTQYSRPNSTDCATALFTQALNDHSDEISEADDEPVVQAWARNSMLGSEVLEQILENPDICPQIQSMSDEDTITFAPVTYKFPLGRTLTINYSTQKKILKQLLLLSRKPSLPTNEASPKLMDPDDPALYMNTEPAWYAIMVVQHDSLSEFVGPNEDKNEPEKNNTVSMQYINENINNIYPRGYYCTSKSAITPGNNYDTINKVVHEVVDMENDSNDYYVAGDVNLGWVMYAEIAADIIITVATWGGGAVATGALKGARATKTAKNLIKSTKALSKLDDVKDYVKVAGKISQHTDDIAKLEKNIKNAEKYEKALKNAEKARKAGKDATKYEKEAQEILDAAKKVDPKTTAESLKNVDKLKDQEKSLRDSLKTLEEQARNMEKNSKNVADYKKQSDALADVMKYRKELRSLRRPQTGNIITRALRSVKTARGGTETLDKAARAARAGMSSKSAKIGDWLFQTTLKHGSRLARFESKVGFFYGVVSFLGDMYDYTSNTSKEFSNGIEFKPLCLLSADDLEGQENVVNYGMWLMWVGNSTDPADDDAAYLQAMDFAEKFYYKLTEYQKEHGANCDVDIYVVRPIIRLDETNKDNPKGQMFYLFMNDVPWSTSAQFNSAVSDKQKWNRDQENLRQQDPSKKRDVYTKQNNATSNG